MNINETKRITWRVDYQDSPGKKPMQVVSVDGVDVFYTRSTRKRSMFLAELLIRVGMPQINQVKRKAAFCQDSSK